MSKVVMFSTRALRTLEELEQFIAAAKESMPADVHPSTVYLVGDPDAHLIEETLTDGSLVHNIALFPGV